jgi:hypothetical protein
MLRMPAESAERPALCDHRASPESAGIGVHRPSPQARRSTTRSRVLEVRLTWLPERYRCANAFLKSGWRASTKKSRENRVAVAVAVERDPMRVVHGKSSPYPSSCPAKQADSARGPGIASSHRTSDFFVNFDHFRSRERFSSTTTLPRSRLRSSKRSPSWSTRGGFARPSSSRCTATSRHDQARLGPRQGSRP